MQKTSQQSELKSGFQRPQFDIQFLMIATAALAVWLTFWSVASLGSKVVLAVVLLTFLFGCNRTRCSVASVVPGLFVPYLWLMWDWRQLDWQSQRNDWLPYFWQLPGILLDAGLHPVWGHWFSVLTVFGTLAVFFAFVMLGRVSRLFCILAFALALAFSVCNSLICVLVVS